MQPRDLYGLPLERFIPERGALAKAMRADGKRDEAAEVAKLRKPSVAAWAVNQLVRSQSREVNALFKAGDQLQRAQADLLAGKGDAGKLRTAADREREAVDELTAAARGLLSSEGHELTQATLDRVSDTLHAAALDDDARAEVKEGCLVRELRHVGLGGFGALAASPPAPKRDKAEGTAKLKAAKKAEADTRRVLERATRDLEAAQVRRERAADSLREAEEALAAANAHAEEAARDHEHAAERLTDL
jgi:hypothetical protein